jgi:hypothetical protein
VVWRANAQVVGVAGKHVRVQGFAELVMEYIVSVQRFKRAALERLEEVGWEQNWSEVKLSVESEKKLGSRKLFENTFPTTHARRMSLRFGLASIQSFCFRKVD